MKKDIVDELLKYSKEITDYIKVLEERERKTGKCYACDGRGIVDLPGEGDVGWGHVKKCSRCNGENDGFLG